MSSNGLGSQCDGFQEGDMYNVLFLKEKKKYKKAGMTNMTKSPKQTKFYEKGKTGTFLPAARHD